MGTRENKALGRVLNQFINSQRYIELLRTVVTQMEAVDDLLASLSTLRWVDTATGVWLDEVGDIVGIPRFFEEDPGPYFTYKDAYPGVDDPDLAYSGLPGPPLGGKYLGIHGVFLDTRIDDDTYRRYIKAKAKTTGSAGTMLDVYTFVLEAFLTTSTIALGGTRLIHITTTTPLTPGQKVQLLQWAPINAGINVRIMN